MDVLSETLSTTEPVSLLEFYNIHIYMLRRYRSATLEAALSAASLNKHTYFPR